MPNSFPFEFTRAWLKTRVNPSEGSENYMVNGFPESGVFCSPHKSRLAIPVHGFRQHAIEAIPDSLNGRNRADLSKALAVANRGESAARVQVEPQSRQRFHLGHLSISIASSRVSAFVF